jgi:hypothetical protein
MSTTFGSPRKVPATPQNLTRDRKRKEEFDKSFRKWEKQATAIMKMKKCHCRDLKIHLKRLRTMVRLPAFGFILTPVPRRRGTPMR